MALATMASSVFAGVVNVADIVGADGKTDVSAAIQRIIDSNPNRTLWFPDGTYLLSAPICTPADPRKSVDLRLSNYAVLKAAPGWKGNEAMVRLGGIHPANNIRTVGSCYSLTGGVIDGSGVAKGVSIDSGRETKVRDVSMKNVFVGLHIKPGANGNSSDCDISDVNIVGNNKPGSVGVLVESCDNSISNMRITDVQTGVWLMRNAGGNLMRNLHPLCALSGGAYAAGIGFKDEAWNNNYYCCYSDQFSTGFLFGRDSGNMVLNSCIVYWYAAAKGMQHTAIRCEGKFRAQIADMQIGFRGKESVNTVIQVGEAGGNGYLRDPRLNQSLLRKDDTVFRGYLQGTVR